ncbi:GxxExxY protein [Kiritimatiella glycovorans]|uniref:GxxExxY protein n=1 Tax=Kiritimatiella glycovorans TaxID=1307763 RepID=UPI00191BF60A|nr:GxxExxY protein [Kiritimatiella glycovorans]
MDSDNEIGKIIVDAAVRIHTRLGPGLLETVYESVLAYELRKRGLSVDRQVPVPVRYESMLFDEVFRADMIVAGKVIVELKAVERVKKVHMKQVLTYLRLSGLKLGFLLNFNADLMKYGITRLVNGLGEDRGMPQ